MHEFLQPENEENLRSYSLKLESIKRNTDILRKTQRKKQLFCETALLGIGRRKGLSSTEN